MVKLLKYCSIISLFALLSCSKTQTNTVKHEKKIEHKADQMIVNIKVAFVDSNYTKARLIADSGFVYNITNQTILKKNILVEFFSKESEKRISTLVADSVVIDDNTKNMTAYGKVRVESDSSHTSLETKLLMWSNKDRKLFTPEFVKIISPNEILQGYGFESDEKLSYYKIFKVTGEQR